MKKSFIVKKLIFILIYISVYNIVFFIICNNYYNIFGIRNIHTDVDTSTLVNKSNKNNDKNLSFNQ